MTMTAKRYDNPARDAYVASIGDPAFDRASPAWPALRDRYVDTRSIADLAALPVLPAQLPTLWRVRPLTVAGRAMAYASSSASLQRLNAVRLALIARVDGPRTYDAAEGRVTGCTEVEAQQMANTAVPQAHESAVDAAAALLGGDGLDELGDVILHRASGNPRRMLPFPLPPPSVLL